MRKDMKRIFELIGVHKKVYFLYIILTASCGAFLSICIANSLRKLIDFFAYQNEGLLNEIIVWVVLSIIIGAVIQPIFTHMQNKKIEDIMRDIRIKCFSVLQDLPVSYYDSKHSGDTFSIINRSIDTSRKAVEFLVQMTGNIISIIIVIPYIIDLDWRLGIIAFMTGLLSVIFNIFIREPLRRKSGRLHEIQKGISEELTENVMGFNIIKMFNMQNFTNNRVDNTIHNLIVKQKRFTRISAFNFGANAFLGFLNSTLLSAIGSWLVIIDTMTIGVLVGGVSIAGKLTNGIIGLGRNVTNLQKAFAGTDAIYKLFNEKREPISYDTGGIGENCMVKLNNIIFGYGNDSAVINSISLKAKKGQKIALVGNSGGGKSTLLKLILGLYPVREGEIVIDGKPMSDYSLEQLRSNISYVPQDAYVFSGTIRENILYGNTDATEEELIDAAKKANAHGFIQQKPEKYDTYIGERGIKLSGGQKQRIAIARAILKDSPILLLDEATSSLDSEAEEFIQEALDAAMMNKTSIIIAHRLSTIENADIIYYIEDGCIVEKGVHIDLIKAKGKYYQLYYKKFA